MRDMVALSDWDWLPPSALCEINTSLMLYAFIFVFLF